MTWMIQMLGWAVATAGGLGITAWLLYAATKLCFHWAMRLRDVPNKLDELCKWQRAYLRRGKGMPTTTLRLRCPECRHEWQEPVDGELPITGPIFSGYFLTCPTCGHDDGVKNPYDRNAHRCSACGERFEYEAEDIQHIDAPADEPV